MVLASIGLAYWDAIGRTLGKPLWLAWCGHRNRLPLNVIGGYYGPDVKGIYEVVGWIEAAFQGCKVKVGGRTLAADALRVEAVRRIVGDEFVVTDHAKGYGLAAAPELRRCTCDLNIHWFEEPCLWSNDRRDMRELRARGGIPVCAGQSEYSPRECRDLMAAGAIDIYHLDACCSGGVASWLRPGATSQRRVMSAREWRRPLRGG